MRILIVAMLACILFFGCRKSPTESKVSSSDSRLALPNKASVNIASIDDAFSLMLNSKYRSERYAATLYLKSHLGDETINHYGNLLFKTSHLPARIKVYESMGFFGGSANASILTHYLQVEEEVETKVQIICSLGLIGNDAAQFVRLLEYMRDAYPRHYENRKSHGGSIVVKSSDREWIIREDSMSPDQFVAIVNESIKLIRGN